MIVVFAEKLPPSVRGKLKLWMIEPTPNVFVSSVSDALAERVAEKLFDSCPKESSMLIVRSKRTPPGYVLMQRIGSPSTEKLMSVTGLQLVRHEACETAQVDDSGKRRRKKSSES